MAIGLLNAYLPMDRRHALAMGFFLPDRAEGAVLLADVVGFTPLADALASSLGPQRGAEELTRLLNAIYDALIAQVHQYGGSVVGFAGDGLVCWFDEDVGLRAIACGIGMHQAVAPFAAVVPPYGGAVSLSIRCSVAAGPVRRFLVGAPHIDLLAGATLGRMAQAEQAARQGEVVVAPEIVRALGDRLNLGDEREGLAVVAGLTEEVPPTPWPELDPNALSVEQMHHFLLGPVYERLMAGQGEFLAELRPAAALFLRFAGLDYEREKAGAQLDAYVRWVQEILARYEGHLLQLTAGDKGSFLYVAFGALAAHEDDAARAVGAAMTLHQIPAELDFITGVQVGLSRGRVRAGAYGSRTRRTYGAIGPEVMVACRLMEVAPPGGVWCSPAIHEAASGQWTFEPLEPVPLKGKTEPMPVYRPVQQAGGRAVRATGALIGRRAEVEVLSRLLVQAQASQRRVLLLEGEAGIGKSRLVAELGQFVQEQSAIWLAGAGQSIEQRTPYRAWRDVLAAYFGLDHHTAQVERQHQVREQVTSVNPALAERVPLLNDVLRLDLPETDLTQSFDPKLRHESLTALIVDLLRARTADGAVVLVLEDSHWLDSLSWGLALSVARALVERPVLLVLALRPLEEPVPAEYAVLAGLDGVETLRLDALLPEQTVALAAARLGIEPEALPLEMAELVQERAGGNPFFAEELTHVLRDSGVIVVERGACTLAGDLATLRERVPDTVEGVVLARIDRLPPEQQLTLKVAAVIGRSFLYRTLHDVHPQQVVADLLRAQLDDLEQRDLTLLEALEPELSYLFKHVITQQVAYDTLLFSRRRELHRAVAGWYERVYGENLSTYYPLLVYHWNRAEDVEQERRYARLAGEQAAAQYANTEAVRYLSRALELTPVDDPTARFDILLAREKVYDLQGDREAQSQDLEALEGLAAVLDDGGRQAAKQRAEVTLRRASHAYVLGDYPRAIAAAQEAAHLARTAQDVRLEAEAHRHWGWAFHRQGNYEDAFSQEQAALKLARGALLHQVEADILRALGAIYSTQGDYASARVYFEQSLSICREIDARRSEGMVLNGLSSIAGRQGDYVAAKDYTEQALHIHRQIGDRWGEVHSLTNLGSVALVQNDYATAGTCYEQALRLSREIGDRGGEGLLLVCLGSVFSRQCDYITSGGYVERSLHIYRQIGDRYGEGTALQHLGLDAYCQGDYDRARCYSEQAWQICHEIGVRRYEGWALSTLGRVLTQLGDYAAAKDRYEQALRVSNEIGDRPLECLLLCSQSLLLHQRGDDQAAHMCSRQALLIAQETDEAIHIGNALVSLGHALVGLGRLEKAADAYRRALDQRREQEQHNMAMEPLAGLARVSLAQGHLSQAQAWVEEILEHLGAGAPLALDGTPPSGHALDGAEEPFQVCLTCYQVLHANGDPRAQEVLSAAYDLLQGRAAKIEDEELCRSFLENVAAHREIVRAWEGKVT